MKDNYDVIVIGAGVGGLTAGALLAKKGLSVAVFEAHKKPGGYCTSFSRNGFKFDACLDAVSGCGEGGWLRTVLGRLGVEDEVAFYRLSPLRVDRFGRERVVIPGAMPALMDTLYRISPREKEGILGLLKAMEEVYRAAMVTPPDVLYNDPRLAAREGALARYRGRAFSELLDDFVRDGRLRGVMCDRAAFMGLPPSRVSAVAMSTMFMTYALGGGYRITGGADNLASALVKGLEGAGGELHTRTPVTEISVEHGRTAGVIAGGERVAARAVVSAIDAASTAGLCGHDIIPDGLVPSVSFFLVYLGVRGVLDIPDSMGCYPGHDIEGTFADISKDIASPRSSMEMVNYSRISPDMAPERCTGVMLMAKAAYDYADDWAECKKYETDRMVNWAERIVPGIRGSIVCTEAATPRTLSRYTANTAGAAFGWEQSAGNHRPGPRTGVPGLWLAGHWTYPGGGIEPVAASGIIAAESVAASL